MPSKQAFRQVCVGNNATNVHTRSKTIIFLENNYMVFMNDQLYQAPSTQYKFRNINYLFILQLDDSFLLDVLRPKLICQRFQRNAALDEIVKVHR